MPCWDEGWYTGLLLGITTEALPPDTGQIWRYRHKPPHSRRSHCLPLRGCSLHDSSLSRSSDMTVYFILVPYIEHLKKKKNRCSINNCWGGSGKGNGFSIKSLEGKQHCSSKKFNIAMCCLVWTIYLTQPTTTQESPLPCVRGRGNVSPSVWVRRSWRRQHRPICSSLWMWVSCWSSCLCFPQSKGCNLEL